MHQRIGKTHSAGPMDGPDRIDTRTLTNFFQECFDELDETGDDAAFYFEQLVEHINNGGSISTDDPVAVRRILGA